MNCVSVKEKLVLYIDGELSEVEMKKVEKHLSECSQCAAEYKLLLQLNDTIDILPEMSVPRNFAKEIIRKASKQPEEKLNFIDWWQNITYGWKAAACIVAIAGMLFGGIFAKFPFANQMTPNSEIKLLLADDEYSISKSYTMVLLKE